MTYLSDFDSGWKDALDAYLPQFLVLLWPRIHAQIDWRHPPELLDKELQALLRSRARGRRHVDKLVSVRLLSGQQALVLIHVEIQSGSDPDFAPRMFAYHVRLREKHPQQPVVGLAVLTGASGKRPSGRIPASRMSAPDGQEPLEQTQATATATSGQPEDTATAQTPAVHDSLTYTYSQWGCELQFTFPVIWLEDWRGRQQALLALAPQNPFAVVMLAQLEADATRDAKQRLVRKTALVRRLYHWGLSRDNVVQLFRIIDAIVGLPEPLEFEFEDAVNQIERELKMPYVTSIERVQLKRERAQGHKEGHKEGHEAGREEGRQQGLTEGQRDAAIAVLESLATRKFGHLPDWASVRITQADYTTLNRWVSRILDAQRIEDIFD